MKGALIYILQNCQVAFEELKQLNSELASALNSDSFNIDVNRIGALHRMVQDYLIIRIAGLFDANTSVASFENLCPDNPDYLDLKQELIIRYIIQLRHNFAAHANLVRMEDGQYPETDKILKSNLSKILQKLLELAK